MARECPGMLDYVCPGQGTDSRGSRRDPTPGIITVIHSPHRVIHNTDLKLNPLTSGGHYLVTTQTLRAYLNSRPLTVPSGPDLARQHSVDPKTVTKLLQEAGYVREPHPSHAWRLPNVHTHAVESNLLDMFIKLATSSNYLISIPQDLTLSVLHKVPYVPYTTDPEDPEHSKLTEAQEHWNAILSTLPSQVTTVDVQRYILFGLRLLLESGKLPIRAHITPSGLEPYTLST